MIRLNMQVLVVMTSRGMDKVLQGSKTLYRNVLPSLSHWQMPCSNVHAVHFFPWRGLLRPNHYWL